MWNLKFNTLDDFLWISAHDLAYFCQIYPTCPQIHKYTRTSINWLSDGLLIWAGLHLMWNVEFSTMDDFLCNFPSSPQFPKYTKTGLTQPADGLGTWRRLCLIWNVEFYTLDDFLCIDAHDLSYMGLTFLTCPSSQTAINWLSDDLYTWVRFHLMSNVEFNTLNDMPMI